PPTHSCVRHRRTGAVAAPRYRRNPARVLRVIRENTPQFGNAMVHRASGHHVLIPPHAGQQMLTAMDLTGIRHEVVKQSNSFGSGLQHLPVEAKPPPSSI